MKLRTALLLCGAALAFSVQPVQGHAQANPRGLRGFKRGQLRAQDLPGVLRKAIAAAARLRLHGERVVDQRVQGQLVRHREIILRDGFRTRIEFPSDSRFSGQIILDDGSTRRRWTPRNRTITEQPSTQDDTLNRLVGPNNRPLRPHVNLSDGGFVAGIATTKASIVNGQGSVVQELYVDPNTGAVLKRVGYDRNGEIVANFEYTSVTYNPSFPRNAWNLPASNRPVVTPESTLKQNGAKVGVPPLMIRRGEGFRLASSKKVVRGGVDVLEETYLGSGGRLSVFVLRHNVDPRELEKKAGRNINTFVAQVNNVTVVLVGPYPGTQLVRLSDSLVTP